MSRRLALRSCVVAGVVCLSSVATAEPLRVLVAVGHRQGLAGEAPLKHAVADARRVREVFVRLGGVRPENAVLLEEPSRAQLFAGLDRAAAIARSGNPKETTVVFYFSGHGDRDRIHLGSDRVDLQAIDAKLATLPANLKIVVADACRSAELRTKGVSEDDGFAIRLGPGEPASGVVHIHASADGEVAQESDALGGAVFTHFWVNGLSGAADSDGDARVTLAESYAFAYGQTLYRSARSAGVVQRPAAQFDLREAAPVILTTTANASAIKLPRARDVQYVVYGVGSRTVVGEMWSAADRNVALAVVPGRYVVARRIAGRAGAAEISVGPGEQRELGGGDFRPVPEETLASKGGELDLSPHELSLGYAATTARLAAFGHDISVGYANHWADDWDVGIGAVLGMGSSSGGREDANVTWLGAQGLVARRWRAGATTLRLGVGLRMLGYLQTLRRVEAERVEAAGYEAERRYRSLAFGPQALAAWRFPLGSASAAPWIEVFARGDALGTEIEDAGAIVWSAGAGAALGISF